MYMYIALPTWPKDASLEVGKVISLLEGMAGNIVEEGKAGWTPGRKGRPGQEEKKGDG